MGDIIDVNLPRGNINPILESTTGVFVGLQHYGVTLSGTCDGTNKTFVLPAGFIPYMPGAKGLIDSSAIVVYDDGVAVTVTTFDPATGSVTLTTAPAALSVMTCDFAELAEFCVMTDHALSDKWKTLTWIPVRSSKETTVYGSSTTTLQITLDVANPNLIKLGFDPTTGVKLNTPPQVSMAIVHFKHGQETKDWGYYAKTCDMVFDTVDKGKGGDFVGAVANLSIRSDLIFFETVAYPINAGVPA